jgi:hypothetical protein
MPIKKELLESHRSVARIWKLQRRPIVELLISGSQVRALLRPPLQSQGFFAFSVWTGEAGL